MTTPRTPRLAMFDSFLRISNGAVARRTHVGTPPEGARCANACRYPCEPVREGGTVEDAARQCASLGPTHNAIYICAITALSFCHPLPKFRIRGECLGNHTAVAV